MTLTSLDLDHPIVETIRRFVLKVQCGCCSAACVTCRDFEIHGDEASEREVDILMVIDVTNEDAENRYEQYVRKLAKKRCVRLGCLPS